MTYRWWTGEAMNARRGSPRVLTERPPKPRTGSVWAPDDPLPGLAFAAAEAINVIRR